MSKYKLARYPQDKYRFEVYDNVDRHSWQKIKAKTGCYALINLTYFNLRTFQADDTLMVGGKWVCPPPWGYNGLLVDKGGRLTVGPSGAAVWGYANAEPYYRLGGVDNPDAKHFDKDGSTFVGVEADGTVVLLLAPKDTPITSREGVAALAGCRDILRYDGSWSSQGSLGLGLDVDPSQERIVRSYLLVFEQENEKEDEPVNDIKLGIMTRSDCYKTGRTITPKGIMVHSTATPGIMAQALRDKWDTPGVATAVHAFVDDKGIVQALPWNYRAWHAGGKANDTHISFEICEPQECRLLPIEWVPLKRGGSGMSAWAIARLQMELQARGYDPKGVDGNFGPGCEAVLKACQKALGLTADGSCGPTTLAALAKRDGSHLAYRPEDTADYFAAVWAHSVALCTMLCKEYGLDPLKDILCHAEGYKAGIASNHSDVMHWFPRHGKSMDDFRQDVKALMTPAEEYREAVKTRFGLADETVAYIASYQYGPDLLRKLATQG
jgi:hypothetical protein